MRRIFTVIPIYFRSVYYNESDLGDVNESTLALYHFHDGAWDKVDGSAVNLEKNYVYGNISSFSIFAVMGSSSGVNNDGSVECTNNSLCADNQFCNSSGFCQNLSCQTGYHPEDHICKPRIGCKIGAKVGAKIGGKTGAKNITYSNTIEISECSNLNISNSIYFLTVDLNSSGNTCMNITAENVSLDCRWHKIKGNGSGTAIKVDGSGYLVENCIIENFHIGIMMNSNETTAYCNMIQNNTLGMVNSGDRINNGIYKNLIRQLILLQRLQTILYMSAVIPVFMLLMHQREI
ncbi:hypothetical protein BEH94_05065 [Candidatus Altiarchaeales archaeon WOR_SM1_SCG]|nr:hypothetical protein BEH94_05065 [Candidatus Altiarchaeales archaeon WOR_SM1_SCG]